MSFDTVDYILTRPKRHRRNYINSTMWPTFTIVSCCSASQNDLLPANSKFMKKTRPASQACKMTQIYQCPIQAAGISLHCRPICIRTWKEKLKLFVTKDFKLAAGNRKNILRNWRHSSLLQSKQAFSSFLFCPWGKNCGEVRVICF